MTHCCLLCYYFSNQLDHTRENLAGNKGWEQRGGRDENGEEEERRPEEKSEMLHS